MILEQGRGSAAMEAAVTRSEGFLMLDRIHMAAAALALLAGSLLEALFEESSGNSRGGMDPNGGG